MRMGCGRKASLPFPLLLLGVYSDVVVDDP